MMDEDTKERFRWKFYSLVILFNLVVLFFAFAIISYFMAPQAIRLPLAVIFLATAFVMLVYSRRKYRETRSWLDEQT
jgi:NADH:ubiquinone oxidoreductase subunit 3 (subunit A)